MRQGEGRAVALGMRLHSGRSHGVRKTRPRVVHTPASALEALPSGLDASWTWSPQQRQEAEVVIYC